METPRESETPTPTPATVKQVETSSPRRSPTPTTNTSPMEAMRRAPHTMKRSRKGFSVGKQRILTIEAAVEGDKDSDEANTEQKHKNDSTSRASEWWKLEYRAPPPGHLGAHAVPVVAHDSSFQRQRIVRTSSAESTGRQQADKHTSSTESVIPSSRNTHETPERAHRRPACSEKDRHSSPSQKRKIIDLQDYDAAVLASMVVAKELKRFHEPSSEQPSPAPSKARPMATTPSKLVRPLTQIDIQGGSSSTAPQETVEDAPSHPQAPASA
ncbi:hypothetical protein Poli38472_012119 [Pythium oligandrum]|uniref:Uncharacterized protein n=1 Tax=Pythium oligandrum TaxID=41045 RepID=A0A8K1FQX1_PYTOL|nr:hypothetical protein Poli38472_012119 [Pythium oligandrum]|eukprot:TMW67003.1 hypothetical protein Poli38472_012119 [Pythium oligandrum]